MSQNGHHQTKSTNNKCRKGCAEKGTLLHCCREYKLVHSLWKKVQWFLKKLKIELPYDPTIPLLGIHLEKTETLIWKDTRTPVFTPVLFTKATYMSINKWMDKEDAVHIFNRVLVTKKNKTLPFSATWMDLDIIILSEVSQTEKDKYYVISLICGILKLTQMNLFIKQKHIYRHRKQTYGYQKGKGDKLGDWN